MRNNYALNFTMVMYGLILFGCQNKTSAPSIQVTDVWSRPVALVEKDSRSNGDQHMHHNSSVNGAVYMTLQNKSSESDYLVSVSSEVAETVEIHETKIENDRMMMVKLDGGVEIQPNSEILFKPGGKHIMLIGLKQPLIEGERFDLMLTFEKSESQTITSHIKVR